MTKGPARPPQPGRIDFVQDHFLKDPGDSRNYDLVLNATRLPLAQSAGLIVEALHRLETSALEKSAC